MAKMWFGQEAGSGVLSCGATSVPVNRKAGEPLFLDNFFDAVKRIVGAGNSDDLFASGRGNKMSGAAV